MYLSSLSIENFRSIKSLKISFQKDLNVFVGKNNTGKSTVIDAVRLVLSSPVNNPNPIWITEDDFYKDSYETARSESITIAMEFTGLSDVQRTRFFEIVDFDLANMDNSIARIIYKVSWPLKAKRASIRRVGGPDGPEMSEVPQKIMDLFSVIYLPALRDAEVALTSGNKSQLASLLKNLAKEKDDDDVTTIFKNSNELLSKQELVSKISDGVNEIIKGVVDSEYGSSKIVAADADFFRILKTLQLQLDGNPISDLSSNGLGSNNLLYIAVVLQYLKSVEKEECPILLVEEPEAHLHPQMVLALSRYLSEKLPLDTKPQTFVTTHSPTLVTDIPLDKMFLQFKKDGNVCCNALKNAGFTESEKRQFSRLMDITKSTLYFAKGVILVEGISEAILMPVLAQRIDVDLRKKQISVIPICGVSFEIFKKIFNEKVFDIPVAIITDGDPEIEYPQKTVVKDGVSKQIADWENAVVKDEATICDRTQNLLNAFSEKKCVKHSSVTLEYDLAIASEDNPLTIVKAWEKCFIRTPQTLNETVINSLSPLKEKALKIWRVVCLSGNSHGKGDLASNLASLLEEKAKDGKYLNKFTVPQYIQEAINIVNDGIN